MARGKGRGFAPSSRCHSTSRKSNLNVRHRGAILRRNSMKLDLLKIKDAADVVSWGSSVSIAKVTVEDGGFTMDLFEHRYYRISKTFMVLLGQWPYQSARAARGIVGLLSFIAITGLPPPIFAFVKYRDDSDIFLECVISGLFVTVGAVKFFGIVWNSQKMSKLLNRIVTSWQVWARCQEVNILHEYAERGEKMTIAYAAGIYATIVLFTIQPMIPKIIDVALRNGTEIGKFVYPVDYYYFDAQKYYFYINLHCCICASFIAMGLIASDTMLIVYVQHVCGVFAALGHKLERVGNDDTSVNDVVPISSLIDRHNDAIE